MTVPLIPTQPGRITGGSYWKPTPPANYTAMRLELGVRNASALVANFYAAEQDVVRAIQDSARRHGELVVQIAFDVCPVDTGFMREHIRLLTSPGGLAWEVGWDAADFFNAGLPFYPWFVEFGTVHMVARPTLTWAHAVVAPMYEADVAHVVRAALERRRAA